jgi:putative DNA methylase
VSGGGAPARALIETALPLERINRAAVLENQRAASPLHLWWSRKPAAAGRALLLASLLADPGEDGARRRLLELVAAAAEAAPGDPVLEEARSLIRAAGPAPAVLDPFCGTGAIPAEAQRLGLEVVAGDLNPVAVVTARALLEIPERFAERPAVHRAAVPRAGGRLRGLVADLAAYGTDVGEAAREAIGAGYPPDGEGRPVVAWLWARTAPCPNPACGRPMPLLHSFTLSAPPAPHAWLLPRPGDLPWRLGGEGDPPPPDGTVGRGAVRCLHCGTVHALRDVRARARETGLGRRLLCLVVRAGRRRAYAEGDAAQEAAAAGVREEWGPDTELPEAALGFGTANYGFRRHRDLYTPRQVLALSTFCRGVRDARARIAADALRAGWPEGAPLREGGRGALAYAEAVSVYLALALDRAAAKWCTFARWHRTRQNIEHPFATPGLPMPWDFAEANPFDAGGGGWGAAVAAVTAALGAAPAAAAAVPPASCIQGDAAAPAAPRSGMLVCTDPPYFDKVPFADTADLFYVWLRPAIGDVFPDLFRTVLTPKGEELVADRHRFGGPEAARARFRERMTAAFRSLGAAAGPHPLTVFYAFQEDGGAAGEAPGWEVVLESLIAAGLQVTGTWPLRTEHAQRLRTRGSNTLASTLVLVCRPRPAGAPRATRREFASLLRRELPAALAGLSAGGVSPADLAQAAIGPGMAAFTRYAAVLDGEGTLGVGAALRLIADAVEAHLAEATADLDPLSRLCLAWAGLHGFDPGPYGEAEVLARAKDARLEDAAAEGLAAVGGGRVRLLPAEELAAPRRPPRSAWSALHRLMAAGGPAPPPWGPAALRALAHGLYRVFDRRGEGGRAAAYDAIAEDLRHSDPGTAG